MEQINGILIRKDLSEIITERFATRYHLDLSHWISPSCYYKEVSQSILSNGTVLDGTYVIMGVVNYPGEAKMDYYTIGQFNLAKVSGLDLKIASQFKPYPNVPSALPLDPTYPMFRISDSIEYKRLCNYFYEILDKPLTTSELESKLSNITADEGLSNLYKLRLALQHYIKDHMYKEL